MSVVARALAAIRDEESLFDAGECQKTEDEDLKDKDEDEKRRLRVEPGGVCDGTRRTPVDSCLESGVEDAQARREGRDDHFGAHAALAECFFVFGPW